jgi:hypothetical protein
MYSRPQAEEWHFKILQAKSITFLRQEFLTTGEAVGHINSLSKIMMLVI